MCLIIYGKIKAVKRLDIEKAWGANPDGAGTIEYKADGTVRYSKGIMKLDTLREWLRNVPKSSRIAIHFRQATHGAVNPANCHPWKIDEYSLLMHNGILQHLGSFGEGGTSDSGHLAKILGAVDPSDRVPLLKSLSGGRYLYSKGADVTLIGDWQEWRGVHMSNRLLIPWVGFEIPRATGATVTRGGHSPFFTPMNWNGWDKGRDDMPDI